MKGMCRLVAIQSSSSTCCWQGQGVGRKTGRTRQEPGSCMSLPRRSPAGRRRVG
ncbi:hypothetical protein MC885_010533 [Smutsia gigantea]|nr:hypothetical protein MC885_010533 [Smutsia gigantea]